MAEKTVQTKVKFPIGFKLVSIITILLLVALLAITALVSVMVSSDVRITAEDNNFTINRRGAAETESFLSSIKGNSLLLLDSEDAAGRGRAGDSIADFFFERNPSIGAVMAGGLSFVSDRFFLANEGDPSLCGEFAASLRPAPGSSALINAAPFFHIPVLALVCPWADRTAVIVFSADSLTESYGTGTNSTFLVNYGGDILVHADAGLVQSGASLAGQPVMDLLEKNGDLNLQSLYTDADGERYFAAYSRLSQYNAAVITQIQYKTVFEGIAATTWRNVLLTGAVLFLAILFVWFFSKTISAPAKELAAAAGRVERGDFNIDLKPKSRDELGLLTKSFTDMSRGLAERERLKDAFGRFTNREVAARAARGELSLGGENKNVTVFFSDIRRFTEISEHLEPGEVVEFLNQYMTRMVACVNGFNGVVDKFIGDAVMAVWGAPISEGSPEKDALNCVKAALAMRTSLLEFNAGRGGEKQPLIRIGCGINTGAVIAGQIGSQQRMEYTVIGDAVNLASRTESLNKPLGTDILITEDTWELTGESLITEEMPPVTVKGKEKPVRMFAVVNLKGQEGPQTLDEVRELLGFEKPDMSKVNVNAEEKKYKIKGS